MSVERIEYLEPIEPIPFPMPIPPLRPAEPIFDPEPEQPFAAVSLFETDVIVGPDPVEPEQDTESDLEIASALDEPAPTQDLIRCYLNEIGKEPLLSAETEVELAMNIAAGLSAAQQLESGEKLRPKLKKELALLVQQGEADKDRFIRANLRLVVSVAKKYTGNKIPFLDLIQEGNLGLIRAVEKFDYTKGYKFSTYAPWWIRQSIQRSIPESNLVRIPIHTHDDMRSLEKTEREMIAEFGYEPTDDDLAAAMDIKVERVAELRKFKYRIVSLEAPVGDEGDTMLKDLLEDKDTAGTSDAVEREREITEHSLAARGLIKLLPVQERKVLKDLFGLQNGKELTQEDIAEKMKTTRYRVSELNRHATATLLHPSNRRRTKEFNKAKGYEWQDKADCLDTPTELFFPAARQGRNQDSLNKLCGGCVVKAECGDFAINRSIKTGIWGETNERQRDELIKQKSVAPISIEEHDL